MNIDDIKSVWKNDMQNLETRVKINEEKIKQLEFNKAQSSFDKFLKISLAGKNMALVYAIVSIAMIYLVRDSWMYASLLGAGAGLMIFSYFQHSVLKKIDYASLTIVELQKAIYNFRIHTQKTAVYDMTIVAVWLITVALAFLKAFKNYDLFADPSKAITPSLIVIAVVLTLIFASKKIYKDYDVKLKESEANLETIKKFEAL